MSYIKSITVKPLEKSEVIETENDRGFRFAVVFELSDELRTVAIFDQRYWAEKFIKD